MNLHRLIELAIEEDLRSGDITSQYLELENSKSIAYIIAKEPGIIAGLNVAIEVFKTIDLDTSWVVYRKDGDAVKAGDEIIKLNGKSQAILSGERVALNFLQRLSGVATLTRKMADLISPYGCKLLDTRKTTPLLRELEKYAVRIGGGYNHRFGLYDMIMIKENHIRAAGGITQAVEKVRKHNVTYKIEVEVTNQDELKEAVEVNVDRVMLDNMELEAIQQAVAKYSDSVELEVSGGVKLENIEEYAKTGVHFISSGSMTHSYKALDISLMIREI